MSYLKLREFKRRCKKKMGQKRQPNSVESWSKEYQAGFKEGLICAMSIAEWVENEYKESIDELQANDIKIANWYKPHGRI